MTLRQKMASAFSVSAVVGIHEIQPAKLDQSPQLRDHAHPVGAGIAAAHKVLAAERGRHGLNRLAWRKLRARLCQHGRRDIRGQNAEAKAGMGQRVFAQHHGQRVGLFAGRAARAPDQKAAFARLAAPAPAAPSRPESRNAAARERSRSCWSSPHRSNAAIRPSGPCSANR